MLQCFASDAGEQLIAEGDKLLGDFWLPDADQKYREALRYFQSKDDKAGMALALEKIGCLASNLGDYAAAVQCFRQALTLYSTLHLKDACVRVVSGTGAALHDWGDMQGTIHYYKEALRLGPAPADQAWIESKLGTVYAVLGDYDESLNHFKAGKTAAQAASDPVQLGSISMQIADVHRKAGSIDQARAAYRAILGMKAPASVATQAQIGLGDLLLASGNATEAESCYRKANYSIGLGRVALINAKFDDASKSFQYALTEGERHNDFELLFAARTGLGLTSVARSQNPNAEEHLRRAVEALEQMRDLLPVGQKLYFLSGTTHGFSRLATYEALVAVLTGEGRHAEAFKIAEYTRSRVLTETLSKTTIPDEKDQTSQAQSTASPATPSPDTTHHASHAEIETVPFSFLYRKLATANSDSLDAVIFSLLVKAAYQDFDKSEADQANSIAADLFKQAGFNTNAKEMLKSKLADLRRRGVQNHLTSLTETGFEK